MIKRDFSPSLSEVNSRSILLILESIATEWSPVSQDYMAKASLAVEALSRNASFWFPLKYSYSPLLSSACGNFLL